MERGEGTVEWVCGLGVAEEIEIVWKVRAPVGEE